MYGTIIIILLCIVALFITFIIIAVVAKMFYRKVEQGQALIINGPRRVAVNFRGGLVLPVIDKAELMDISVKAIEIDRRGKGGLICKDNIRADITVSFYVRVTQTEEDVRQVASLVGCQRASRKETLEELFNAKFSEALKTVGKQMEFEELFTEREQLKEKILNSIGKDLNGYSLDDVAIDYLEQTPLEALDEKNVQDSQGIRKIVALTSEQKIQTNERQRHAERVIKQEDVETREKVLELERQQADAEQKQKREILTLRAREEAETKSVQEQERLRSETARIATEEKLRVANENMERTHIAAIKAKEQTEKVEEERVHKAQQLEMTERERLVAVKTIEKEKAIEVEKKNIQEVIRERVSLERTVAEEEEKIKDVRVIAAADRERKAQIITAERDAEEKRIGTVQAAQARQEAAGKLYEEAVKLADADKVKTVKAAEAALTKAEKLADAEFYSAEKLAGAELIRAQKHSDSDKILAAGIEAKNAADGLAQVRVREATAAVIRQEGEANAYAATEGHKATAFGLESKGEASAKAAKAKFEVDAEGTRISGAAEADAINAKADAMKNFDGVGREHEEFKLRLAKAERIERAQIDVHQKIAEAQAVVLGEAMKTAKIELVGGGGDFLETFFRSISLAKSVDGFVGTSVVAQNLLSGDHGDLIAQVKSLIGKEGLKTEDIKNMTVSAVLARLALQGASKDTRTQAKALQDQVDKLGVDELMALWLAK